eukprot:GHUV01052339.1.p1 GENE.GHUV01052339.1~~GHUV01052339.1.p1  ORF type:complete len:120 (-),score=22.29 GHUV01052339.1:24-383(-)
MAYQRAGIIFMSSAAAASSLLLLWHGQHTSPAGHYANPAATVLSAELRKALYAMFSQFGKIVDVVALKTLRLRGQAWIVFSDVAAATNAKNTMQGFPFFDKPIVSGCCWAFTFAVLAAL